METNVKTINPKLALYETTKDDLIVRPLHIDSNFYVQNAEKPFLYKRVGCDLALVVYRIIKDNDEELVTERITQELAEKWEEELKISEEDIFNQALENTQNYAKARLYTNIFGIEQTPEREADFMATEFPKTKIKEEVILVTTKRKTNGAVVMFYPNIKERLAELLDGNYYVAFTSRHEAMVHKFGTIDVTSIKRNLTETNRIFGPDDTLTNQVWYYNIEDKTFRPVA